MKRHAVILILLLMRPYLGAQENPDEVRKLVRNTLADAIEVPLVQDTYFAAGSYGRIPNSVQIQPVLPLDISDNFHLVTRIVATPYAYLPDPTDPKAASTGMTDTTIACFLTPVNSGKLVWGIGPAILVPTATNPDLGGGKWDVGPSIVLITEPKWGSAGVLVQNIWSLPGHRRRASVDQMQIETQFSYNLRHDWYLLTAPTISSDWTQANGRGWLVPFGAGIGRAFYVRHQALDSNLALYYNAIRPAGSPSPKWQLSLQVTLVYPRKPKTPR
jgi:hypothetical protein